MSQLTPATPRRRARAGRAAGAFTLIEVLVVLACLTIAAYILMPVAADASASQLRAAAVLLVADLEYAQSESLGHADDPRQIVFDAVDARSYSIAPRSTPATPITHPVERAPYVTTFGTGRAAVLGRVRIAGHTAGADNRLGFGSRGELDQTAAATITLSAGPRQLTITLDPITGEASVGNIQ